jgi:hypothetical protein
MKLSIIIVSWNVREVLLDCLQSIDRHPPSENFEIILVDNASTDRTVDAVRPDFPQVSVMANDQNRGFAAANNQGLAGARGEYLLLLNPDTIVHPHSLNTLCAFMDRHPDAGACGPRLLNEDGTIQASVRRFPSFRGALYRYTILRYLHVFRGQYEAWWMKDFRHDRQMDVDQLMGAALMLRRAAVDQVGRMDERFFLYYEEVDLCYRLKQAGWRVVFVPEAIITHLGGQSSKQVPVAKRVMALSSLLRYFRKHRGPATTGLFNCLFKPAVLARELCEMVASSAVYAGSLLTFNSERRRKAAEKIGSSATLLGKHSWWLLFKA